MNSSFLCVPIRKRGTHALRIPLFLVSPMENGELRLYEFPISMCLYGNKGRRLVRQPHLRKMHAPDKEKRTVMAASTILFMIMSVFALDTLPSPPFIVLLHVLLQSFDPGLKIRLRNISAEALPVQPGTAACKRSKKSQQYNGNYSFHGLFRTSVFSAIFISSCH